VFSSAERNLADEYNRRAKDDRRLRRCVRDLDGSPYAETAIARPIFARLDDIQRLTADITTTIGILDDLPDRCFGGSVESYLAAQGYDAAVLSAMLAGIAGPGVAIDYGRADVFRGPDGFRVLELNMGSPLGGRLTTTMNAALLKSSPFAEFAAEFGLTWVDPVQALVNDLRTAGRTTVGTDEPVVAVVDESDTYASTERVMVALRSRNVNAIHGEFRDIDFVDGKARLRGQPVDVILRFFFVRHIPHEEQGMATLRALVEAHRAGRTALFTPFDPEIHDGKAALGLLFEPDVRATLSDAEIACVDRIIPWTRLIGPAFRADRAALIEDCRARQRDLVLKPANLWASQGVVFGDQVDESEWRTFLESPPRPDYVVQEHIRPPAETVLDPETGEPVDWTVVWQVFFGPAGYDGCSVRGRLLSQPGAIGGNEHTTSGCVFAC
jgi:hypothetical protein